MYLKVTIFFLVFIPQCKTKRMDVKYKQENSLPSYKIYYKNQESLHLV